MFGAQSNLSVHKTIVLDYKVLCLISMLKLDCEWNCKVNKEWFLGFDCEITCRNSQNSNYSLFVCEMIELPLHVNLWSRIRKSVRQLWDCEPIQRGCVGPVRLILSRSDFLPWTNVWFCVNHMCHHYTSNHNLVIEN